MLLGNLSVLAGAVQNPLIISSGLVGYWSMNDGSGLIVRDFDSGSLVTNGVLSGSTKPAWVSGRSGTGLFFAGIPGAGYVNIPDAAYLRPGAGDWSISCWINAPNVAQNSNAIISKRDGVSFNQMQLGIGYADSGGSTVSAKNIGFVSYPNLTSFYTTNFTVDGNWHHIVLVRLAVGNPLIYVDGVSQALTSPVNNGVANLTNTVSWEIGWNNNGAAGFYSGSVDDVRLYNRALNPAEVTALYKTPVPLFANNLPVLGWAQRVALNGGGTPSQNTVTALDVFYTTLNSASLIPKMMSVNCFVPDSLAACLTPLIIMSGSNKWTSSNFAGTELSIHGLTGNSATPKFLDAGFNPSTMFTNVNNSGLSCYVSLDVNETGCTIGAYNGVAAISSLYTNYSNTADYDSYYNGGSGRIALSTSPGAGFFCGNRVASNDQRLFFGNLTASFAQTGSTNAGAAGSPPNTTTYIFGIINATQYSSKRISFVAFHEGMNITQSLAFFNAVVTLRQNLGGGYV
jgi:hypothetical protein